MKHSTYMQDDIDNILGEIASKDSQVLCREVLSIGDTMDVLRSKWTVEILTAILCGNTRFKDILTAVRGLSDKVLTERLRQMAWPAASSRSAGSLPRILPSTIQAASSANGSMSSSTAWRNGAPNTGS